MTVAGVVPASLLDYPGHVAVTLFVAGCNLRCPYCHNPALVLGGATTQEMSAAVVLAFLRKRRTLVDHVCVTGGEPTLRPDLLPFLEAIKDLGYTVKLDSNGSRPEVLTCALRRRLVDYVAMDIKTAFARYAALGGTQPDSAVYAQSVAVIRAAAPDYEFRTTVVPGLVERDDVLGIARALRGARRYALQQFVGRRPLLDPNWSDLRPHPANVLRAWAREAAAEFGGPVELRNL